MLKNESLSLMVFAFFLPIIGLPLKTCRKLLLTMHLSKYAIIGKAVRKRERGTERTSHFFSCWYLSTFLYICCVLSRMFVRTDVEMRGPKSLVATCPIIRFALHSLNLSLFRTDYCQVHTRGKLPGAQEFYRVDRSVSLLKNSAGRIEALRPRSI